jgi:hypothetical protein
MNEDGRKRDQVSKRLEYIESVVLSGSCLNPLSIYRLEIHHAPYTCKVYDIHDVQCITPSKYKRQHTLE